MKILCLVVLLASLENNTGIQARVHPLKKPWKSAQKLPKTSLDPKSEFYRAKKGLDLSWQSYRGNERSSSNSILFWDVNLFLSSVRYKFGHRMFTFK